jgi:hypothetical protein
LRRRVSAPFWAASWRAVRHSAGEKAQTERFASQSDEGAKDTNAPCGFVLRAVILQACEACASARNTHSRAEENHYYIPNTNAVDWRNQ